MDNCDHCDLSRLVNRPAQDSIYLKVYYGSIASRNQVMKHGRTRDKLAQELNVICFKIEAAGLIDSFPCLVIRRICDYSNSYKNKQ
jgi:nucleoside phosphorylase